MSLVHVSQDGGAYRDTVGDCVFCHHDRIVWLATARDKARMGARLVRDISRQT